MISDKQNTRIRICLEAFDSKILDSSAMDIVETAKKSGVGIRGPVRFPRRIEKITVNRSPHVDKKSRDQLEIRIHKCLIDIVKPTPQTVDALMGLEIAAGVNVVIRL
ncbi:MAG: 30S ribosomal protein S10 [Candidatus Liberibacter europaeus]|uniref:Small ribosomal subunit protein uS10 n=1 Tax=Candidatus Liberibacter europaeus TaxID=744859 RepID=A0A2T4VY31_9HYPH|nr:30S ribosomal protein S10 [Candidatus Liberibacter europaeus]PTL86680.1 MAG: 30S ribosomal protein S10 [Candidatus Liberibacter europaeus]